MYKQYSLHINKGEQEYHSTYSHVWRHDLKGDDNEGMPLYV